MDANHALLKHGDVSNISSYEPSSTKSRARREPRYYRPAATSPWTFIAILVLIAGYIALLEILLSMQKSGPSYKSSSRRGDDMRRQVATTYVTAAPSAQLSLTSASASFAAASSTTVEVGTIPPGSQLTLTATSTPAAASQLSLTAPPETSFTNTAGAQLSLTSQASVITEGAQLSLTSPSSSTSTLTLSAVPSDQLSLTTPSAVPSDQLSLTSPSLHTTSVTLVDAISSSQLSLTEPSPVVISPSIAESGLLKTTAPGAPLPSAQLSLTTASPPIGISRLSTPSEAFTIPPGSQLSLTTSAPTASSSSSSLDNSLFSSGDPAPASQLTLTPIASHQLSITTTTKSSANPTSTFVLAESHVEISGTFTKLDYFLSLYLPTLFAVLLQAIWTVVFAATKMMEPFHQLAKPNGALARDSVLAEYLSSGLSLSSLRAILAGHWVMALASVIYFATGLLAPLASESMGVEPTATCATAISRHQPCAPAWIVYLPAARSLEGILALLFVLIFLLLILSSRRKSGVIEDPSSIKAMASLLAEPAILRDFQSIESNATKSDIRRALSGNRYKLGQFESHGEYYYGIFKVNRNEWQEPSSQYGLQNVLFFLLILTLLGLTLAYYLDSNQTDVINTFFNSNKFGPRFLMSSFAVLIASGWKSLEREIRMMEPYRKLAARPQPATTTINTTMTGTPYTTVFVALARGDLFVSWIALVTILSDILIIAATGIPFTAAQIRIAEMASFYISFGIMGLMLISLAAVMLRGRSSPRIPRDPDSLANVWLYLCGSNMIGRQDWHLHHEQGQRYWFALARGVDGKERWMVDGERGGIAQGLSHDQSRYPHSI